MADKSILSAPLQTGAEKLFDDWANRATNPAPTLPEYGEKYMNAEGEYRANPLVNRIEDHKKERDAQIAAGSSPDEANALFNNRIKMDKKSYIEGVEKGRADPNAEQVQKGIFQMAMAGDYMGAVKSFLMSIPFVGDLMAAGGKFIMARVNGEKMTFTEAREKVTLERSIAGGLANIGAGVEDVKKLVDRNYAKIKDSKFEPTKIEKPKVVTAPPPKEQPTIQLDETFTQETIKVIKASPDRALQTVAKQIEEGKILLENGVGYATPSALITLNNVKEQVLPGRVDGDWAGQATVPTK